MSKWSIDKPEARKSLSPEKKAIRAIKTPNVTVSPDQWRVIFEQLGLLVVFFPEKWRKLAVALVAAVSAIVLAFVGFTTVSKPNVNYNQASAITVTQQDLTLRVPDNGGPAKVIQTPRDTTSAAPLMDWNNLDVREGRVQRWYLEPTTDESARFYFRALFNELVALYPENAKWEEVSDPRAPYKFGATAQTDCGIGDEAVACAVYLGPRSGRVSYNGNLRSNRVLGDAALRVGIAHEFQHIVLNLGHNSCGYNVRSVMTPVDLRAGTSCSNPPATGIVVEDHEAAIPYYNLQPAALNPPTPSCRDIRVVAQEWTVGTGGNEWNIAPIIDTTRCLSGRSWLVISTVDGEQQQWSNFIQEEP